VIRMQRSPYGTSLPGAGTVHHINHVAFGRGGTGVHFRSSRKADLN
jgi:hypothetical protein